MGIFIFVCTSHTIIVSLGQLMFLSLLHMLIIHLTVWHSMFGQNPNYKLNEKKSIKIFL